MSSRTASSDTRQANLLLVHATNWYAAEATLRSVTEFQQAGTVRMTIPYRYICAYSFSDGKCIPFWVFKLNASFYFHPVLLLLINPMLKIYFLILFRFVYVFVMIYYRKFVHDGGMEKWEGVQ